MMNWIQQFKHRVEQEVSVTERKRQTESASPDREVSERKRTDPTPAPKAVSTDQREVSERERKLNDPIPIKDLSRDELVVCIRQLEDELNATPVVIEDLWIDDLRVQLRALEAQKAYLDKENQKRAGCDENPIDWHDLPSRQWGKMTAEELDAFTVTLSPSEATPERLLTVWKKEYSHNLVHRQSLVDLAFYNRLFVEIPDREKKWEALKG